MSNRQDVQHRRKKTKPDYYNRKFYKQNLTAEERKAFVGLSIHMDVSKL